MYATLNAAAGWVQGPAPGSSVTIVDGSKDGSFAVMHFAAAALRGEEVMLDCDCK